MHDPIQRFILTAVVLCGIAVARVAVVADTTQPDENAADLYLRAASLIKVYSPAETNEVFPNYPPFNEEWRKLTKDAWEQNQPMRELVRQASSVDQVSWPTAKDSHYLNQLRSIANEVGDAALYAQLQGDHAEAIAGIRDLLHMVNLLEANPPHSRFVRLLVGTGIQGLAAYDLMIIESGIVLTKDSSDTRDLWISDARDLVEQLFSQPIPNDQVTEILGPTGSPHWTDPRWNVKRIIGIVSRNDTDQDFAAMSLACHIFLYEKGHWPNSLAELMPAYLPMAPVDPWGDEKQTLGYVLVKGGLPDGSDRPLVFSRCNSRDGLFYRLDEPEYGYYTGDGSRNKPPERQKQGGEFRDVARWTPPEGGLSGPTTRAYLPQP